MELLVFTPRAMPWLRDSEGQGKPDELNSSKPFVLCPGPCQARVELGWHMAMQHPGEMRYGKRHSSLLTMQMFPLHITVCGPKPSHAGLIIERIRTKGFHPTAEKLMRLQRLICSKAVSCRYQFSAHAGSAVRQNWHYLKKERRFFCHTALLHLLQRDCWFSTAEFTVFRWPNQQQRASLSTPLLPEERWAITWFPIMP